MHANDTQAGGSVLSTLRRLFRARRPPTPASPLTDAARMQLAQAIASHYLLVADDFPLDPAEPPSPLPSGTAASTPWWSRLAPSPPDTGCYCCCSCDNGVSMVAAREHPLFSKTL